MIECGETLLERYRVDEQVGEGGMGLVFSGTDLETGGRVAVKTLHSELAAREDLSGRFMREARTQGLLDHPNIAEMYTMGSKPDGSLFVVMEFVEGQELADWVGREELRPVDIIDIVVQVFSALHYAAQFEVVHRDIKPENVMISAREIAGTRLWVVKLIDFGLVKVLSGVLGEQEAHRLTRTGAIFGTPEYMAPEQASGLGVDLRTDIYAAGVMLYELLTGDSPYVAEDPTDILRMHMHAPLPALVDLRYEVPEKLRAALDGFVRRCMAKDPADRYQTPAEAQAQLRALRELAL